MNEGGGGAEMPGPEPEDVPIVYSAEAVDAVARLTDWVRRRLAGGSLEVAREDGRRAVTMTDVYWVFRSLRTAEDGPEAGA